MDTIRQVFFELLQVALGTRPRLSRTPSPKEWCALLHEAQRQTIVGVMAEGLDRLPVEQRPPTETLLQWIGLSHMAVQTHRQHVERVRELTERFHTAGFKCCVLKGVGLAQLYPKPEHRQCGDIDLWVGGDRGEVMRWLVGRFRVSHAVWHHVEASIFDDVKTEIHFHPGWMYNPWRNARLQRWFDRHMEECMRHSDNTAFSHPTAAFNAVYTLVHTLHHLVSSGIGLRHMVDHYYITLAVGAQKDAVMRDIKRLGLLKIAQAVMWVLCEVCGMDEKLLLCAPDEHEGRFLLEEIMHGGNFGRFHAGDSGPNGLARMWKLLPHYPAEAVYAPLWKAWHRCWRIINNRTT